MHRLYDLMVACDRQLPGASSTSRQPDLIIAEHPQRRLPDKPYNQHGYTYETLTDGSIHVSWSDLFDFRVAADGSRIDVHVEATWHREPVYTYLLSQVMSVALLSRNIESLHGSAAAFDNHAIVLLGHCGYGKSTLTAALVQAGAKLLTDDLVVLRESSNSYNVAPGAHRLKLHPATAASLGVTWSSVPMEDGSGKHVYQLDAAACAAHSMPVSTLLLLQPSKTIMLEQVVPAQAVRELLSATFNPLHDEPSRLQKLLINARQVAARVPILRLHVPRSFDHIPAVVQTIRTLT